MPGNCLPATLQKFESQASVQFNAQGLRTRPSVCLRKASQDIFFSAYASACHNVKHIQRVSYLRLVRHVAYFCFYLTSSLNVLKAFHALIVQPLPARALARISLQNQRVSDPARTRYGVGCPYQGHRSQPQRSFKHPGWQRDRQFMPNGLSCATRGCTGHLAQLPTANFIKLRSNLVTS